MNEKDLVTLEQAKKLKELGFDWECLYHYDGDYLDSNGCRYDAQDVDSAYDSLNTTDWNPLEWIDAPFLYQVQNWLREEKNIHIIISICFVLKNNKMTPQYSSSILTYENGECVERYTEQSFDYYEALNAGINEALELL